MKGKVLDYKKEYKDLYLPNPEFQEAVELLYGLSFTIKMSNKKGKQPSDYCEYVVPPLEGLWWIDGGCFSFDIRDNWQWTLMIRQPEFVTREFFKWACDELTKKKPGLPIEKARFAEFEEGLCVQVMHVGPYAAEPETIKKIESFILANGLRDKVGIGGKHHEIYLSDPRKAKPENMKTVLRHPVERR